MELLLKRNEFSDKSTIGKLFINGEFFCYVLEDKDRGLTSEMSLDEIAKIKVYAQTAIPYGRYQVLMTFSNRFKKIMPLVYPVKGYEGIRIHTGNSELSSAGCLIVGMATQKDRILRSQEAFDKLYPLLEETCKKEKVYITIEKDIINTIHG